MSRHWTLWSFIIIIILSTVATVGRIMISQYSCFQVYKRKKYSLKDDSMEE